MYVIKTKNKDSFYKFVASFEVSTSFDGENVATIAGYSYPDQCTLEYTFQSLKIASCNIANFSSELYDSNRSKLNFLDTGFPEGLPYDQSFFLEAVWTNPEYRKKGLSSALIRAQLELGKKRGCPRSMLIVAKGNEIARKLYEKVGFRVIGEVIDAECKRLILSDGFDIMTLEL
jgi:ribosomal protein S18 acetylase RimI-like enzyme